MSRYDDQILDEKQRPVAGATIYVYDDAGALDTLTADDASPLANPLTTDQFGMFYFNADDGEKVLDIWYGGRRRYKVEILVGPVPIFVKIDDEIADDAPGALLVTRSAAKIGELIAAALATERVTAPVGFAWTPPVKIYRSGNVFTTDFYADDWKEPATTAIWVKESGNNTTGNGTQGNPYRGIARAMQHAAAGADVGYNIFVEAGEYRGGDGFLGQTCDRHINLIAVGGRVLATNKSTALTSWTLDGPGTYKATHAIVITDVRDWRYPVTWPNGDQTPQILTKVLSLAECQATPGTWYVSGSDKWVHLSDGRVPDAGPGGDVGMINGNNAFLMAHNRRWFMQGFDIEGGGTTCIGVTAATGVAVERLVLDDCRVWLQTVSTDRAVRLDGVATAILNRVRSFGSAGDGIGYSRRDGSSPSCNAMEIECVTYGAGRAGGANNFNGSTNHAAGRTIRVNCVYRNTYGPIVADVNESHCWCLGVDAQNCLLDTADSQDSCFQNNGFTGSGPKMWLDACKAGGAHYDLYSDAGCQILYRNMAPSSIGGAGTIGTY